MADGSLPPLPKNIANAVGSTSLPCPECGGGTAVKDSRPTPDPISAIRRRRVCIDCRHRFTTIEINAAWAEKMVELQERLIAVEANLRQSVEMLGTLK